MCATYGGACSEARYGRNDTVFRQGDASDAVFYIQAGRIELRVISEQGKEGVIAMLSPGDFFGEGCLAGEPVQRASAIAMDQSSVLRIPRETMVRALHEHSEFSEMFTAFLLTRNIQIQADLIDQLFNSSEKRLARVLLLLADLGGNMERSIPKVSQDALAARVGTTRSRINFFMNKFRRLGFIEYDGRLLKVHASLLDVVIPDSVDAPESLLRSGQMRAPRKGFADQPRGRTAIVTKAPGKGRRLTYKVSKPS